MTIEKRIAFLIKEGAKDNIIPDVTSLAHLFQFFHTITNERPMIGLSHDGEFSMTWANEHQRITIHFNSDGTKHIVNIEKGEEKSDMRVMSGEIK